MLCCLDLTKKCLMPKLNYLHGLLGAQIEFKWRFKCYWSPSLIVTLDPNEHFLGSSLQQKTDQSLGYSN